MKLNQRVSVINYLNYMAMIVFSFLCVYPFIYVAAISLNDGLDAQMGGIYFIPRVFTLENYKLIFTNNDILNAYSITIFRVVTGTFLSVILCAAVGYAMSRSNLLFKKFFNWMILIPMYFGGGLIPYYIIIRNIGLLNNIWVYVLPALYGSFNIILIRTFMKGLPESLCESARLDGAGDFIIFARIVFPLSGPVLAAVSLFVAVGHWNDWFTGTVFVNSKQLWPASTLLLNILRSSELSSFINPKFFMNGLTRKRIVTPEALKMAMIIVTTVPILIVYPFLQKYFVKGVMVGSLKD